MCDDDSTNEQVLPVTPVGRILAPSWANPPGSQGCARQPFGAFDGRRLNPVLNGEVGSNGSPR